MGLAPAVRVTPDICPDTLHIVKGFLVDDGLMGILKNRPLAFVNIVAFLVLEVLAGLEIDSVCLLYTSTFSYPSKENFLKISLARS